MRIVILLILILCVSIYPVQAQYLPHGVYTQVKGKYSYYFFSTNNQSYIAFDFDVQIWNNSNESHNYHPKCPKLEAELDGNITSLDIEHSKYHYDQYGFCAADINLMPITILPGEIKNIIAHYLIIVNSTIYLLPDGVYTFSYSDINTPNYSEIHQFNTTLTVSGGRKIDHDLIEPTINIETDPKPNGWGIYNQISSENSCLKPLPLLFASIEIYCILIIYLKLIRNKMD